MMLIFFINNYLLYLQKIGHQNHKVRSPGCVVKVITKETVLADVRSCCCATNCVVTIMMIILDDNNCISCDDDGK